MSGQRVRFDMGQAGGRLEAGWRQAGGRLEAGWRQAGGRLEAASLGKWAGKWAGPPCSWTACNSSQQQPAAVSRATTTWRRRHGDDDMATTTCRRRHVDVAAPCSAAPCSAAPLRPRFDMVRASCQDRGWIRNLCKTIGFTTKSAASLHLHQPSVP